MTVDIPGLVWITPGICSLRQTSLLALAEVLVPLQTDLPALFARPNLTTWDFGILYIFIISEKLHWKE